MLDSFTKQWILTI